MSPARIFLVVSAVVHLLLGAAGLMYEPTFPIGPNAVAGAPSAHIFGVFETNGWHTVLAVGLGAVSLYFALRPRRARDAALAIGASQAAVWVSLLLLDPSTLWLASNAADQFVHLSTAVAGIGSGSLTRQRDLRPKSLK